MTPREGNVTPVRPDPDGAVPTAADGPTDPGRGGRPGRSGPVRVLELRTADGAGGGPDKTIMLGAAQADPGRVAITVCYLRKEGDASTELADRARGLGVDYQEVRSRGRIDIGAFGRLRRLVRDRSIDVVHSHEYKSDVLAALLARAEGTIPLATAHGWTGHTRRERWAYYPLDRRVLVRFPRVLAVSSQIRDELIASGARPDRVTTLLNGIDPQLYRRDPSGVAPARARFGIRPGDIAIGSVGRVEPQKRYDLLLEAFALRYREDRRLKLLIAGEGSLRAELALRAEALGLGDSCRFLGHCADVRDFYHALDLFAQSSDYEGTPNVVLEAMSLEVPIVATDVGGTAELVRHEEHGLIIPPGDPVRLAEGIARALDDARAASDRAAAARERVETQLSFQSRCRALEDIYDDILSREGRCRAGIQDTHHENVPV